jgi:hypothetical protein
VLVLALALVQGQALALALLQVFCAFLGAASAFPT